MILVEADKSHILHYKICPQTQFVEYDIECKGWDIETKDDYWSEKTLYDKIHKIYRKANNYQESKNENLDLKLEKLEKQLIKVCKKAYPKQISEINSKSCYSYALKYREYFLKKHIYETFQERNNSLKDILDKTHEKAKLCFVIAGTAHFCEIEELESVKEEMSVAPLRNYLNGKKAIILKQWLYD